MAGHSVTKYIDRTKYYTAAELCEATNISRDLFYKLKKKYEMECIQWGHGFYYERKYIEKLIPQLVSKFFEGRKRGKKSKAYA